MEIYISKKANLKIYLPIDVDAAKAVTRKIIAILTVLAVVSGIVCLTLSLQITMVHVEIGDRLSAEDIAGDGARFDEDFEPSFFDSTGVYHFGVILQNGSRKEVRLTVRDTKAPSLEIKEVYYAIGGALPTPKDFAVNVYEPNGFGGEFIGDLPSPKSPGKYQTKVRYFDAAGNKTKIYDVNMNLIYDSIAPTIEAAEDIFIYVGESVAYRSAVTVSDNCVGEIELIIDDSLVNTSEVGEYKVKIVAADSVGNKSKAASVTVHVVERDNIKDELESKIAKAAGKIISDEMTTEQKCRAVYEYIQKNVDYVAVGYKGDIDLAAYNALFVTGEGDCYSFCAAAKAFFDYLGIESLEVQRMSGYTADTHFWNPVNIGEGGEDRWYHFDATPMRREYAINSCLLTDAQTEAYGKMRQCFYKYDKSAFPAVESKIITPNSNLES